MKTIHKILPVLLEIKPSLLLPGQIGLFAARFIKKDTIIAETKYFEEFFHSWEELKNIDTVTKKKIRQYCIETEEGFFVPRDFNWLPVPWNMNHSCNYNVGFDKNDNFVTARNVKKGEELVWDYGMGISYAKFRLNCRCGNINCRKIITGNDWKNINYRQKNNKYFSRRLFKSVGLKYHEK